jgi:HlyD family secretion protein
MKLPALVCCLALLATGCGQRTEGYSGTIESRRVTVSAEVAGRLASIAVARGQHVDTGAELGRIDCAIPDAQLAQAEANLAQAAQRLSLLEAGPRAEELEAARQQREVARQQLEAARSGATSEQLRQLQAARDGLLSRQSLARQNAERASRLATEGAGPTAASDAAATELAVLTAELARIDAQLAEARRGARAEDERALQARAAAADQQVRILESGARSQEVAAAQAARDAATAARDLARTQVARCTLTAPTPGTVDIIDYEVGELVPLGGPVVALGADGPRRIRTYAAQRVTAGLAVGDLVTATLDARIDTEGSSTATRQLTARVLRVYDEAELSSGNLQTPDDRDLLVFRVDLEVTDDAGLVLHPGMTLVVDFATKRR